MCGITGVISIDGSALGEARIRRLITMTRQSQGRGRDATGLLYNSVDNDKWKVLKHGVDANEFFRTHITKEIVKEMQNSWMCFGHVRQGTSGKPKYNVNNHPVIGQRYTIIHNGVVRNDKIVGYEYKAEVDTEGIVAHLDTYGLKDGLKSTEGSASLIILEHETKKIFLWRKNNPLKVIYDDDMKGLFFSSDEYFFMVDYYHKFGDIFVSRKMRKPFVGETTEEHLYEVQMDKGLVALKDLGEIKGKSYSYSYSSSTATKGKSLVSPIDDYDDRWWNKQTRQGHFL